MMSSSNVDGEMSGNSSAQAEGLLPAFSSRQYAHLPTPQSPGNLSRYVLDGPCSPDSPVPNGNGAAQLKAAQSTQRRHRKLPSEDHAPRMQSNLHQYATPESSPHFTLSSPLLTTSATPQYLIPTSTEFTTPKQQGSISNVKLESPIPISLPTQLPRISSSSPAPPEPSRLHSSILSSPFMAKASIGNQTGRKINAFDEPRPTEVDDIFSNSNARAPVVTTNPISPPQHPTLEPGPIANAGGELERIRHARREDTLSQMREAEKRRPEYLKRAKRTLSEADPSYLEEEENIRDHASGVGITESPHKGRRLTLFQETSEESFEESLMAGGYGRYRTADWVRQPQPISLPSNTAGSSGVASIADEADEAPPTEKEIKKRKRLAAFRSEGNQSTSKLCAVELEGKGRVLIDVPSEEPVAAASPEPTPTKKRGTNRRKRKSENLSIDKKLSGTSGRESHAEKPNWPDSEFPWRLRTEERIELAKAEEEERLRYIERFLDRDSDDEDGSDSSAPVRGNASSPAWVARDATPEPYQVKMGRGKMVPLRDHPGETDRPNFISRTSFPSDPADARSALLSKKSVRTLSYRQQKRLRELDHDEEEEIVCICHGKDDGRELVQCDTCQTWYHLECIGIRNIAELGREEDPWFCRRCIARSPSPPTQLDSLPLSEPTFVPTDNEPNVRGSSDTPFFQPSSQDSPSWRLPRTPTRGSYNLSFDSSHSWTSWADSSSRAGPGPSTPQPAARGYDGHVQHYEESPFDPTSTPSRGIRFPPSFATPKNSGFPRSAGLFQTPSKPIGRGGMHRSFGSLPSVDDSGGHLSSHDHFPRYDESPIRRNRSIDSSLPRHKLHSPSRSKASGNSLSALEESPVVRSQLHRSTWNDDDERAS
ncbi:unnamed protein product [Cyclocybe aegerita]|uniref:PHD-type domain-containing protein n=1 Tax=Cyclocybe aegerita TaxID=1973307 RepID=A0A8S0WKJ5_CYCAE|nr:unnamed protein product [Cyclocybe aegerita]